MRQDPIVAATATPDGRGYWMVTANGGVLPFGDAASFGSVRKPFTGRVVAIVATPDGNGYWIACRSGKVYNFGDADFYGSAGAELGRSGDRRHGDDARRRRLLARPGERARGPLR